MIWNFPFWELPPKLGGGGMFVGNEGGLLIGFVCPTNEEFMRKVKNIVKIIGWIFLKWSIIIDLSVKPKTRQTLITKSSPGLAQTGGA